MAMVFEKMERARRRKLKSTSPPEGPPQVHKHKPASRLSSNSHAYTDDNINNRMFTLDLGLSSSRIATRKPMLEKIVSKRLSSSVTSRLGVLERLPSLWRVHRRREPLPDNYKHNNVPIDVQRFKDVHEDLQASCYDENPRYSSRWSASSMLTKSEMAAIEESEDLLMEFDRKQSYSTVNHSCDRQIGRNRSSRSSHTSVLKTSISIDYKDNARAWSSERDSTGDRARSYRKSSKVQLEERNDRSLLPKKIVVLKPNRGESGSSTYRSSIGDGEKIFPRREGLSYNLGISSPVESEARQIAREITRRVRSGCDANETMDAWFRGYAGDRNSDREPEAFKLSSRNSSSYGNRRGMYSSSSSVEWSVNREAKKRLRERWKITQRYQELEIVSKGSTLGEMLAIHKEETSCANTSVVRARNQLDIDYGSGEFLKDKSRKSSSSRSISVPPSAGERVAKGKLSCKEISSSQDSKCRSKKSLSRHHLDTTSSDADFEIRMEPNVKMLSHQNLMFQRAEKDDYVKSPVMNAEYEVATYDQQGSCLQELDKGSTSKSFEEVTSESFEEVSAALNAELRMQLHQVSAQAPVEQSPKLPEGYYKSPGADQDWQVSYAVDVFIHSGLYEFGLDILRMMTWHSPDCPLGPTLFDEVEKKYSDHEMIGLRPERRLLFDSINSALVEIYQQDVDFCPWVMPKISGMKQNKGVLEDALEKLINQESANVQVPEMILDNETQWRDSSVEIDLIGKEIEGFLMEDLIIEFFL